MRILYDFFHYIERLDLTKLESMILRVARRKREVNEEAATISKDMGSLIIVNKSRFYFLKNIKRGNPLF